MQYYVIPETVRIPAGVFVTSQARCASFGDAAVSGESVHHDAIPQEWNDTIVKRELIDQFATDLYNVSLFI
jgi:hypothetical protein